MVRCVDVMLRRGGASLWSRRRDEIRRRLMVGVSADLVSRKLPRSTPSRLLDVRSFSHMAGYQVVFRPRSTQTAPELALPTDRHTRPTARGLLPFIVPLPTQPFT